MGRMVRRLRSPLPDSLVADIESAGYLPAVVHDVVVTAVGRDQVVAHLVHAETTFDEQAVRNHLTVLVLTDRRLVIAVFCEGMPDQHVGEQIIGDVTRAALKATGMVEPLYTS